MIRKLLLLILAVTAVMLLFTHCTDAPMDYETRDIAQYGTYVGAYAAPGNHLDRRD